MLPLSTAFSMTTKPKEDFYSDANVTNSAMLAFETSLTMLPGLAASHRWLGVLYAKPGGDAVKAARHRYLYDQLQQRRQEANRRLDDRDGQISSDPLS